MVCAIDIGKSGGIAFINGNFVAVYNTPILEDDYNISEIARIIRTTNPNVIVIENVHSMPKQGVCGVFGFGRAKGIIEGIASSLDIHLVQVHIPSWKKHYPEFKDLDKKAAKTKARELAGIFYPSIASKLTRVKDDGIADALLIGRYYIETNHL